MSSPQSQAPDDRVQRIRACVDSVPPGQIRTYGEIAADAGLPGRARMVGKVLRETGPGTELPWHRIVAAGGRIATEGAAAREQRRRLKAEGVTFRGSRAVPVPRP